MKETRYLLIKNLPENIREDKVADYFKRYGRVEKVKLNPKRNFEDASAIVAFVDIRSAQNAQSSLNLVGDKQLQISYSDPAAMSSSCSRRSDLSPNQHGSNYRIHSVAQRIDSSKPFEGHSSDRRYTADRHRGSHLSPVQYKGPEHGEAKNSLKRKSSRGREAGTKTERKINKAENMKVGKKKHKKLAEKLKSMNKSSKGIKQKEYSKRKTASTKKKEAISSDEDDDDDEFDDDDSTSTDSDDSSEQSSSDSSASTASSTSLSNSSGSSSSKSSIGSNHGDQKLVTIIIKKLPSRPSVSSLRDGIYHEFKKCGKVKSVVVRGDNNLRHALVLFRNASEAHKAISHAKTKLLFGAAIEASLYDGEVSGKELQECGGIVDEFHPRASRTLFIGNLDKTVQYSDIQNIFVRFGEIVAIDIKKMCNIPQYAFLQYTNIASVVKAIQKMDGELLGRNVLKLGFGKTVMSSCVWVEGVTDGFTEHYLASCFHKYGSVKRVIVDRRLSQALVFYPKYEHAQKAINNLRGRTLNNSRLKLDYASHELVEMFLSRMQNSGQAVTTFDSIRHLLLPTPSGPGIPSSNSMQGSRSGRSGSSHPYPGRPDPYYDDIHLSRYHGPPHAYDSGLPPRSDWRGWEDRNRGRPVYQTLSPRGRRYHDDRADPYPREGEHFDRAPGRYEPDYRGAEYIRREHSHDFHRAYPDDHHRSLKGREHHESFHSHMTPPGRVGLRRSRSISPRAPPSSSRNRSQEFDLKADSRPRSHRDHSLSRGRSPVKSPGSKDSRVSVTDSWQPRKPRDHTPHSPSTVFLRRDDERRIELREPKSLPGSPRSSRGRSRASPGYSSPGVWSNAGSTAKEHSKADLGFAGWEMADYDRSRSETPTRDENTASIGEVIIKQPPVVRHKAPKHVDDKKRIKDGSNHVTKKKNQKSSHLKDAGVKESAAGSNIGDAQRKHSPASDDSKQKESIHEKKYKSSKRSDLDKVKKSKSSASAKEEKKRKLSRSHDLKQRHQEKAHCKPSALIKREFSPSSVEESGSELKKQKRSSSKSSSDHRKHKTAEDKSRKRREKKEGTLSDLEDGGLHMSRRNSSNSSVKPSYNDSTDGHELLKRVRSNSISDDQRASKRSRKSSTKHEAPVPVASQSFMDDVDDEEVNTDMEEPSSQFRPKLVVREEVVEVDPESDDHEDDSKSSSDVSDSVEEHNEESQWQHDAPLPTSAARPRVAIAQPFFTAVQPYDIQVAMTGKTPDQTVEYDETNENTSQETLEGENESADSQEKLVRLEEEKAKLQALLEKLDSKQQLVAEEASQVADVYLNEVANRFKSKLNAKKEKKMKKEANANVPQPVEELAVEEEDVDDKVLSEVISEEIEVEQVVEGPEIVEEHMIVEEEVSLAEEAVFEEAGSERTPTIREAVLSPSQSIPESTDSKAGKEEASVTSRFKSDHHKEKYHRSLLKKQKKETARHKRKVEQMRGPSQTIVSSMIDEEDAEDHQSVRKKPELETFVEEVKQEKNKDVIEDKPSNLDASNNDNRLETTNVSLHVQEDDARTSRCSNSPIQGQVPSENRYDSTDSANTNEAKLKNHTPAFAVPFTSGCTPKSSPTLHKSSHLNIVEEATKVSTSPFIPASAPHVERSSQSSGQSSASATPLTPSPKPKLHPRSDVSSSGKIRPRGDRRISEDKAVDSKQRKSDTKSSHKHDNRNWQTKTPVQLKHFTNLTVSREGDFSKPLDKKELDRLCLEVAKVKKELEISQGFYSPSPDSESLIPPMSPILKSPSLDSMTPDSYGKSGMSPITGASPVIGSSPSASTSGGSTSLTERMKLLGKVKKKMKSDDGDCSRSQSEQRRISDPSAKLKFSNSRFFKSSIFDQDSQRLSHLQCSSSVSHPPVLPSLDAGELPEDKPLFSAIVEKTEALPSLDVTLNHGPITNLPKNARPLSSEIVLPVCAESPEVERAGRRIGGIVTDITETAQKPVISDVNVSVGQIPNENVTSVEEVTCIDEEHEHQEKDLSQTSVSETPELIGNVSQDTAPSQLTIPHRNDGLVGHDVTLPPLDKKSGQNPPDQAGSRPPDVERSMKNEMPLVASSFDDVADDKNRSELVLGVNDVVADEEFRPVYEESVSQDSYIAGLTDVATTEVVDCDGDSPSGVAISVDIPVQGNDVSMQEVEGEEQTHRTDPPKSVDPPGSTVFVPEHPTQEIDSNLKQESNASVSGTPSASATLLQPSESDQRQPLLPDVKETSKLSDPSNSFRLPSESSKNLESFVPKTAAKPRDEPPEKKVSEKKKLEKIRKEKKLGGSPKDKPHKSSKPLKSGFPAKSSGDKMQEKPHKKMIKEEKTKTLSVKTKPTEAKSEKASNKLHVTSADLNVKKESKAAPKSFETDHTSTVAVEEGSLHKNNDNLPKPHKKSDKKFKSLVAEPEKKAHKHENEKKRDSFKNKHDKDSVSSSHKKLKLDENTKAKLKPALDKHKKPSDMVDRIKKEKPRESEFLKGTVLQKPEFKPKMKAKQTKGATGSEPFKKKQKLDLAPSSRKSKSLFVSSSDSEPEELEELELKRRSQNQEKKAKAAPSSSGVGRKLEKVPLPKPKPNPADTRGALVSSDDESSDNFDDFISQMGGGNSRSSFSNVSANPIYTSSGTSEDDVKVSKAVVKKPSKSERSDPDRSDQSGKKLASSKDFKSKVKKHKASEKSHSSTEKSKSSSKRKNSAKQSIIKDLDSDEEYLKKSSDRKTKYISESDESFSDDPGQAKMMFKSVKAKNKRKKTENLSSREESHKMTHKTSPKKDSTWSGMRKLSSSSSDSYDFPPPSPSSSSLLTVETIKDDRVFPSGYLLDTLEAAKCPPPQKSTKPGPPTQLIYTSSSSGGELEIDEKYSEITAEDKKKFFGSDSSDDPDQREHPPIRRSPASGKVKSEQKRIEPVERKAKVKKENKDQNLRLSKPSEEMGNKHLAKGHDHKRDQKIKQIVDKPKRAIEQKQRHFTKQDEKISSSASKVTKEKTEATVLKPKIHDQKPVKRLKPEDKPDKHRRHQEEKHLKHGEHPDGKSKKEKIRSHLSDKNKLDKPEKPRHSHHVDSGNKERPSTSDASRQRGGSDDKAKARRDQPLHAKVLKQNSKEICSKSVKERHSSEKVKEQTISMKNQKPSKDRDSGKVKKISKERPASALAEQKVVDRAETAEKKIPRLDSAHRPQKDGQQETRKADFIFPSPQVDKEKETKMDFDAPGRSFFCSDSSDDEKEDQLSIVLDPEDNFDGKASDSAHKISFGLWKEKENSSPNHSPAVSTHKSLFSPSKDEEATDENSPNFEESRSNDSPASSPTLNQTFVSSKIAKLTEDDESAADVISEETKPRRWSKDSSSEGRAKRLSSYEKFQLEKERHLKHIEELKKESRLRDEEAVRSIMGEEDSRFYCDPSPAQPLVEIEKEKTPSYPSTAPHLEPTADVASSSHADENLSEDDRKSTSSPVLEPRSMAEEDELAAALRSIEGFGDFDSSSKPSPARPKVYQTEMYKSHKEKDVKLKKPDAADVAQRGSDEAAQAASALLGETTQDDIPLNEERQEESEDLKHPSDATRNNPGEFDSSTTSSPSEGKQTTSLTIDRPDSTEEELAEEEKSSSIADPFQPAPEQLFEPEANLQLETKSAGPPEASSPRCEFEAPLPEPKHSAKKAESPPSFMPPQMTSQAPIISSSSSWTPTHPFVSLKDPLPTPSNPGPSLLVSTPSRAVVQSEKLTPVCRSPAMEPSTAPSTPPQEQTHAAPPSVVKMSSQKHPKEPVIPPPVSSVAHPPDSVHSFEQSKVETPSPLPVSAGPVSALAASQESFQVSTSSSDVIPPQLHASHSLPPPPTVADSRKPLFPARPPSSGAPTHQTPSTNLPGQRASAFVEAGKPEPHSSIPFSTSSFRHPVSTAPSGREEVKDSNRGVALPSNSPQIMSQFQPHQPMFFPQQGISMYSIPRHPPMSYRPPPFSGFTVPMPLAQSLTHQQPHHSRYLFQTRPPNPFVDVSQEILEAATRVPLGPEPEKSRHPTPSRPMPPSLPQPLQSTAKNQDFLPKLHHAMARPPMLPHEQSVGVRPSFPTSDEEHARLSMSAAGDPVKMVDQHFYMSGVHLPSLSHPSPAPLRTAVPGQPQGHSPKKDLPHSSVLNVASTPSALTSSAQLFAEQFRQRAPLPMRDQAHLPPPQTPSGAPQHGRAPHDVLHSHPQRAIESSREQHVSPQSSQEESSMDLQNLFQRYPVFWQGKLALKNDSAAVQIHYVAGNMNIGKAGLPEPGEQSDGTGMAVLRIMQRMRIKAEQMRSLQDKMARMEDCCLLLALPCGKDKDDVVLQADALRTGFIEYLQHKEVAGIVYVDGPIKASQNKAQFVLHVFPPCDFTISNLHFRAPDLLENVSDIQHLLIVVTPP